jgi:UDP-N-acetylmuramyl pentapeptide synthase
VLEYGIDHPGEMDFLVSIVRPHICILGEITPNHIQQFGTYEAYRAEKLKIVPASRYVVAHESLRPYISQDAIFYGQGALSDIDASHIQVYPTYTTCQVHIHDDTYTDITVPLSGAHQVTNILPLFAIAHIQHIPVGTVEGILPKLTVVP